MISLLDTTKSNIKKENLKTEAELLEEDLSFSGITYCEPSEIEVEILKFESSNRVWIRLTQNWAHFQSLLQMSTLRELDEDLLVGDLVLFR